MYGKDCVVDSMASESWWMVSLCVHDAVGADAVRRARGSIFHSSPDSLPCLSLKDAGCTSAPGLFQLCKSVVCKRLCEEATSSLVATLAILVIQSNESHLARKPFTARSCSSTRPEPRASIQAGTPTCTNTPRPGSAPPALKLRHAHMARKMSHAGRHHEISRAIWMFEV